MNGMFATYESVDQVIDWCQNLPSDQRMAALTAAMIMLNTVKHVAEQEEKRHGEDVE